MSINFLEKFKNICRKIDEPEPPRPRFDAPKTEPAARRFNIHKRSLPPGLDKIVIYNLPSRARAEKLIETATDRAGNRLFAARLYNDDAKESKTYIFYEVVPADATPKERSLFFNPRPFIVE